MDIGSYSFNEFRQLATNFHGYPAPGLLIGAYMVELGKRNLPQGTLFEAVVESKKCLPDAVQLLTVCSIGNNRLKICNLGRYAVSLFDKYTGRGVRISLDPAKMRQWPEISAWFFKLKPKAEQDSEKLEAEIKEAGDSICNVQEITIKPNYIGHSHMANIGICPVCGEAYPQADGPICRGCQGDAPYEDLKGALNQDSKSASQEIKIVKVEDAVGQTAAHDMTRIVPGQFKGPEFKAGQRITASDVCRLQQMGRFHVAVRTDAEKNNPSTTLIHEDEVAKTLAEMMAGKNIGYKLPPREGKIDFTAECQGLLSVDIDRLMAFNLVPDLMCATRQDGLVVNQGARVAGTRAIPLYLERQHLQSAKNILGAEPLFTVTPLRSARVGILVTGTEVFQGLIEDKFIPIITAKVSNLNSKVIKATIVPDEAKPMEEALTEFKNLGCDLLITTGGLSVDPDDITRQTLIAAGLTDIIHGIPMLPGTMSLVGNIMTEQGKIQVLGVPACAL
ncbi:MAG: trehalose-binding protein, partial [Desulfovibrionaceae bacterium]|nr:trehalose-binding protein [Desulfovibrionaceae bacterium]